MLKATVEYPQIKMEIHNAIEDIDYNDFERPEGTVL